MNDLEKRLRNDRLIIFLGALGSLGAVCALVLSLMGRMPFTFSSVMFLVICVCLLAFGIKQSNEDRKNSDLAKNGEYKSVETSKYQTGRKKRK